MILAEILDQAPFSLKIATYSNEEWRCKLLSCLPCSSQRYSARDTVLGYMGSVIDILMQHSSHSKAADHLRSYQCIIYLYDIHKIRALSEPKYTRIFTEANRNELIRWFNTQHNILNADKEDEKIKTFLNAWAQVSVA